MRTSPLMKNKDAQGQSEVHREEYLAMLEVFKKWLSELDGSETKEELLTQLVSLRADMAIRSALKGFGLEYDEALRILREEDAVLTDQERSQKNVLVAAVDNLIEFSTAEEFQLVSLVEDEEHESDEELEEWFELYNETYASTEDSDVFHAMAIAAWYIALSGGTEIVYHTQGDDRVRPWHAQYEGYSAPKEMFPSWLIPPIEHMCRCYLEENKLQIGDVVNVKNEELEMPSWFNPTFKESVAKGGRIFSKDHKYFAVEDRFGERMEAIINRLKQRYYSVNETD